MIRKLTLMSLLAISSCGSLDPAFAQQPAPPPSYATIVLDEAKFTNFYNALTEIPMAQKTWQQIFSLLQSLERDALAERAAKAEALKGALASPPNKE